MKPIRKSIFAMMALVLTLDQPVLAGKSTPSRATDAPSEVQPQVAIALPESGFATNGASIEVVVPFAGKEENGKPAGNVKTAILRLGAKEVGRFQNPPGIKSGTVKFLVEVSGLPDGQICFTAEAYGGAVTVGRACTSYPVGSGHLGYLIFYIIRNREFKDYLIRY